MNRRKFLTDSLKTVAAVAAMSTVGVTATPPPAPQLADYFDAAELSDPATVRRWQSANEKFDRMDRSTKLAMVEVLREKGARLDHDDPEILAELRRIFRRMADYYEAQMNYSPI